MFSKMRTKHIMKQNYSELPNRYLESVNRGIRAVRGFSDGMSRGKLSREEAIARFRDYNECGSSVPGGRLL